MTMPDSGAGLDNGGTLGAGEGGSPPEASQQAAEQAFSGDGVDASDVANGSGSPSPTEDDIKFNPAWNGLLEKIPEQYHHIVAPDLKQWDRNYNNLAQQYAPWKNFNQQGVTADSLQKAYQVYQTINSNPIEVYRRLGEALKDQLPQQDQRIQNQQAQQDSSQYYNDEAETPDENDFESKYNQLQQQFEQLQQTVQGDLQSRQQAQLEAQYSQEIDNTLSQIEQQNGPFDKQDVLQRVAAQMQMGQDPDIVKAYQEQQAFIQQYSQQQNAQQQNAGGNPNSSDPPKVIAPNGGGTPNTIQNTDTTTEEGRAARFAELLRAAEQSN